MNNFIQQTDKALKKKKKRWTTKGRQVEEKYLAEVEKLFENISIKRDELIEYLHKLQDKFGVLYDKHLVALATITNLPMSEIYEVATFYAHFNIVKDKPDYNSIKVVRVCESLTCELFGAKKILDELKNTYKDNIKVLPGPCMGRCQSAPTVCVGKNYVDHATTKSVKETISSKNFEVKIPDYINYERYIAEGGYEIANKVKNNEISKDQIINFLNESGLKGKGGAGFPTGKKWEIVSKYKGIKYIAINGDEGEPGTFKDRFYLEKDPHRFLEGLLVASSFINASCAYIYIRD